MSTYKKIQTVIAALFVGLISMAPLASFSQNEDGVTDHGESTTKVGGSYVNENGKFVCWPRVTSNGKLLTYGPLADTEGADNITSTTATLHGNILHDGWCNGITGQGFEISLDADFTNIVQTVVTSPVHTFTPCATYPTCTCTDNRYSEPVTGLTPGVTYYYRAYATNDCGTGYGDTLTFTTDGSYVVTVNGPTPVQFCPGGSQTGTYTATVNPAMTSPSYQWYLDGTAVTGETNSTYTATFSAAGTHTVKCEITASGITVDGSQSVTVSAYTVPALAIDAPDDPICAGGTGNLTATTGFDTYAWSSNVYSSSANTATYKNAGTYSVTATTTDGCTATASKAVTVSDPQVASATGITGNTTICSGSTTTLTASATASTGATLQYQWKKNGTAISGATSASYTTETLTANTSYSCDVTAVQGTCTSAPTTLTATVTIEESTLASVSISPATTTICAGQTASLTANVGSYNGTLSYQWKQGSTNVGTSASYTTPALSATTTYTCVVTNTTTHGCATSMNANATVTVNHPVASIASLTASPSSVCSGETSTLTATVGSTTGTLSYQWKKGSSNVSGSSLTLTTDPITANTTYSLTQTATVGSCTATDTKSVEVAVTTPSVTTNAVTGKTCVAATFNANNSGCSDARGFVYSSTNTTPTCGGSDCTPVIDGTGTGNWSSSITDLIPDTRYYVQAWVNTNGTYTYGGVVNFKTEPINLTVSAQNGTINLCQEPKQTVVTMTATPDCDASNTGNTYTWSLSPVYPYTPSADGKTITVTVTSSTSEQFNVTGTCTLTHSTGYTVTASDYSIIYKEGNPPEICICEDAFGGVTGITSTTDISTIAWYAGANADTDHDTPIAALTNATSISMPTYTEGYYTILATSPLGCKNTRTIALGFPYDRCASLGTTGSTTETIAGGGVKQITDSRTANGNSATTYRVVKIGSQCWMAENLRYKQIEDGHSSSYTQNELINTSIYTYRMYFTWPSTKTLSNGLTVSDTWLTNRYGYLYTWIGVMDAPATLATRSTMYPYEQIDFRVQGICPDGWHLPTDGEWFQLEKEMGVTQADSAVVITSMRPSNDIEGTVHDILHQGASRGDNVNAGTQAASGCEWYQNHSSDCPEDYCNLQRNTTGFSGMPAGVFVPQYADRDACYQILGEFGTYWSASQALSAHAGHDDFSDAAYVHQLKASQGGWGRYRADKHNGLSVRCVRDMVTTAAPTNLTTSSVTVGGTVLEDGGYTITERGICWSSSGTISIAGPHRAAGSAGTGAFTMTLSSSDLPSGEYQYCAYAVNSKGVYYGLPQTVYVLSAPSVTTGHTSDVSITPTNSITLHGTVTADGGYPATTRGICWGTSANPTTSDNHAVASGTGVGDFSIVVSSGLVNATEYHYRAYATNAQGTTYGEDKTFAVNPCAGLQQITIDGDSYTVMAIGTQCWTANLHATHYADGTPLVRGSAANGSSSEFSYTNCNNPADVHTPYYYEPYNVSNVPSSASTRIAVWGRLYNYYAATRGETVAPVQGICPNGWHIPSTTEWQQLMTAARAQTGMVAEYASTVTSHNTWFTGDAVSNATVGTPAWGITDGSAYPRTSFEAYPVGIFNKVWYTVGHDGLPADKTVPHQETQVTNFWCSDVGTYPRFCALTFNSASLNFYLGSPDNYNDYGFSVRCVKD